MKSVTKLGDLIELRARLVLTEHTPRLQFEQAGHVWSLDVCEPGLLRDLSYTDRPKQAVENAT